MSKKYLIFILCIVGWSHPPYEVGEDLELMVFLCVFLHCRNLNPGLTLCELITLLPK